MPAEYNADADGVAKWLIDNPTKTNRRGRRVSTGLADAYKAVGYPKDAPRLHVKEGNLSNLRHKLRFSPRLPGGTKGERLTLKQYKNHPRYAGDPKLATKMFKLQQKELKRHARHASPANHSDHIVARNGTSDRTSFQHPHNLVHTGKFDNGTKGNKDVSQKVLDDFQIGTTADEMIDRGASSPLTRDGRRMTPRYKRDLISKDLNIEYSKGMGTIGRSNADGTKTVTASFKYDQPSLKGLRLAAKTAAFAGAALPHAFGIGASAAEVIARDRIAKRTGNTVDNIQSQIAQFGAAADAVSLAPTPVTVVGGAVISTGADLVNGSIDVVRESLGILKRLGLRF